MSEEIQAFEIDDDLGTRLGIPWKLETIISEKKAQSFKKFCDVVKQVSCLRERLWRASFLMQCNDLFKYATTCNFASREPELPCMDISEGATTRSYPNGSHLKTIQTNSATSTCWPFTILQKIICPEVPHRN